MDLVFGMLCTVVWCGMYILVYCSGIVLQGVVCAVTWNSLLVLQCGVAWYAFVWSGIVYCGVMYYSMMWCRYICGALLVW